jgi:uncharacterized protein YhhL (DUF1145 family)
VNPAKAVLLVIWLLCGAAFFAPAGWSAASAGRTLFWVLSIAHSVEFLVFLGLFRRAPGDLAGHFVQTFLFGLFHVREVRAALGAPTRDA